MKVYEGEYSGSGKKVSIVVSRFNDFITKKLLDGAIDCLTRHGVKGDDIKVIWVPGTFEIPVTSKKLIDSGAKILIVLGAVIRGDTPHFEYISSEVMKGISTLSMQTGVPICNGILTCDSTDQAIERAGVKSGNKGFFAALNVLEMSNLFKKVSG